MQNLWNESEASACGGDPLKLRVYSSRLLGRDASLVLHGGGNTSLKHKVRNLFGEEEEILYVKGSGWDLATIEAKGFSPVKMKTLLKLAELERLTDTEMVREQRAAMIDPGAPNPSVEAILHAILPFAFVDHTHADAVVALSNTPGGPERLRELFGNDVLFVPYVMPGFILARKVYEMTRGANWAKMQGMILLHHGVFSFGSTARESYDRMISIVARAERELEKLGALKRTSPSADSRLASSEALAAAALRKKIGEVYRRPIVMKSRRTSGATEFSLRRDAGEVTQRGPLTPDHVIHTKRVPLVFKGEPAAVDQYVREYEEYYRRHKSEGQQMLDPAPRWAVWPGNGVLAVASSAKTADVILDICDHTIEAISWAEHIGGWKALPEKDIFDVEYWELEQAKLKKSGAEAALPHQGKVAVVTGAASGIGRACAEMLRAQGAAIVALDISAEVVKTFSGADAVGVQCDVLDTKAIESALLAAVERFGGIDILVSNAGSFPKGAQIGEQDPEAWRKAIELNLSSHFYLLRAAVPFLEKGFDPSVVIIASKNVPAPGPGASAYSSAKAALTQLGRVAALEWGAKGIRVNMVHPNQVFDTGIWTEEVLAARAKHYGMSVAQYKTNNVLRTEVSSKDVARLVSAMAGNVFGKTTGAQVPIDGGNDRVI